ncbi:MAG: trigger factor [Oscillospiraceae bacterium]|nr:trigger factor [Oscillospiraceae bacterium]
MEVTILSQEKGMAVLKLTVPGEELTKALDGAYNVYKKNHEDFDVERAGIDMNPDGQVILRQAVQDIMSDNYTKAIAEAGLTVASEPQISVMKATEAEGVEYQMRFALRPEIRLGQYKGIHVKMPDTELTEEEFLAAVKQVEEMNAEPKTVDRPSEMGDVTIIDFTGYLDGVPFDGGAGHDYALTLGSGTFIPGFEEQLVGKSAGENVLVTVTFPENYHEPSLAGKLTQFRVSVKNVQSLVVEPLTEEVRAQVREAAQQQKRALADQQIEDQVLGKIISDAQVELPEAMVDSEVNICMQQFAGELSAQGMALDEYAKRIGKTTREMAEEMRPLATRRIMLRMVLGAIAEAEGFTVTEEEVAGQWEAMAKQYGVDVPRMKLYAGEGGEEQVRADILNQKAYTLLRESTILDA